jgi:hypothetical protein
MIRAWSFSADERSPRAEDDRRRWLGAAGSPGTLEASLRRHSSPDSVPPGTLPKRRSVIIGNLGNRGVNGDGRAVNNALLRSGLRGGVARCPPLPAETDDQDERRIKALAERLRRAIADGRTDGEIVTLARAALDADHDDPGATADDVDELGTK